MTRPRINPEISLGNIVQILSILGGIGVFVVMTSADTKSTAKAVSDLGARFDRELGEVRTAINALRDTVSPGRMSEVDRRLAEQDTRDNGQDARLGVHAEAIATLRAQFAIISQPGRRTAP